MLSNLSKSPPWPGRRLLKSLTPKALFTDEANKSPNSAIIDANNKTKMLLKLTDKFNTNEPASNPSPIPPNRPKTAPSIVFLGLILA